MTREQCKENVKRWQKDSATGGDFFSVDKLIDKLFSSFEVKEALHEAQLKIKDEEIERLKKLVNSMNNTYSIGNFYFEAYYAMLKGTQCKN